MKNLFLIFGLLFLAVCSSAQYSYVYEIRHDNKSPIRQQSESFDDMLQYKSSPSEMSRSSEELSPSNLKTRDFTVKSPEAGSLLNMLRGELSERVTEVKDGGWPTADSKQSPQIALQGNSNDLFPTYARQPLPKNLFGDGGGSGSVGSSGSVSSSGSGSGSRNELPVYVDKYQSNIVQIKRYPNPETTQIVREEPKVYEQRPVYKVSYPSSLPQTYSSRPQERPRERPQERPQERPHERPQERPHERPQERLQERPHERPQERDEKIRTVHQIQTPNYRIQLVSQPESLEKVLPLIQQYQLNQKPFQSSSSYPQSSSQQILSPEPIRSSYEEPAKSQALVLDVEPDARISPARHTVSQTPESRPSLNRPLPGSMFNVQYPRELREPQMVVRSKPLRQYANTIPDLKEPRPILEMPRQELPPQIQQLKGRPPGQQLPPPEQRSYPQMQSRSSYPSRSNPELVPVTALYQMSAPDLAKNMPSYSRVDYAPEEAKREGRRPTASYTEEPAVYRIVEKGEPQNVGLREELERLGADPSAQKSFFDRIKAQSVEMADRGRTKYRQIEEQSPLMTDPNYKPSPIPDEYKPFTQTRYFKTYI